MKNKEIYKEINTIIEKNRKQDDKSEGLFVLVVKTGKKKNDFDVKTLIKGMTPWQLDVILRTIYGKVYAVRKKDDKKTIELENKFKKNV